MATLSDNQKLDVVITKFVAKLNAQRDTSWTELKVWLGGLTKAKIKTFINSALADEQTNMTTQSDDLDTTVTDYDALKTEIEGL